MRSICEMVIYCSLVLTQVVRQNSGSYELGLLGGELDNRVGYFFDAAPLLFIDKEAMKSCCVEHRRNLTTGGSFFAHRSKPLSASIVPKSSLS